MKKSLLNSLLAGYPDDQEVVFCLIDHSEYSTSFTMKEGVWVAEGGFPLLYHDAKEVDLAVDPRHWFGPNGYGNPDSDEPTHNISVCMYMREDNVMVILS